jgi:hypothetical protein
MYTGVIAQVCIVHKSIIMATYFTIPWNAHLILGTRDTTVRSIL